MTDAYAKLIEEHKRKLEQFVRESQRMLLEIPEFDQQNVPNNASSNKLQQGKKKGHEEMNNLHVLQQPRVFEPQLTRMQVFGDA